jgi:putative restriction endonuclease
MRYWWVNQKQTYRHEIAGGYLWSPKRKANGDRNPFYDFMREVAPGDPIFSYAGGEIRAIGFALSHAYEAPKPLEFGQAGAHWDKIGWRVDMHFHELAGPIRPIHHIDALRPLFPTRYAPLRANGQGQQNIYLTHVPARLAEALVDTIGREARSVMYARRAARTHDEPAPTIGLLECEEHELARVAADVTVPETTRQALVLARRGQGKFKNAVMRIERRCRITGVDRDEHLRASHAKPWRDSNNEERLDGENGLLLTPHIDHLFDRGFISFEGNGRMLVSPVAHLPSLRRMGLPAAGINVGTFTEGQRRYLEFHRESVFLESRYLADH